MFKGLIWEDNGEITWCGVFYGSSLFFFFFPGQTVTLKILFSSNDNDVLISPVTLASIGFDISGILKKRKAAFRCSCI